MRYCFVTPVFGVRARPGGRQCIRHSHVCFQWINRTFGKARHRIPVTCEGSPPSRREQSEPVVKSSYYKNPSRAIEKGGGFYIPGLRGPRLRFFVGGAVLVLLAINAAVGHLTDLWVPDSDHGTLTSYALSNALALLSAGFVVFTAFQDTQQRDAPKRDSKEIRRVTLDSEDILGLGATEAIPERARASISACEHPDVQWVADVVTDMINEAEGVWIFRGNDPVRCVFATPGRDSAVRGELGAEVTAGPVVERVSRDTRVLYVDDSTTLPSGIGFPFLPENAHWSVLLVPLARAGGVFAIAQKKSTVSTSSISMEDRRWIEVLAKKVDDVLSEHVAI